MKNARLQNGAVNMAMREKWHLVAVVAVMALLTATVKAQSPQFLRGGDMADFTVREDTPVGTVVYTLRGHDPLNRPVTYSGSGDVLSVDPVTGAVTLVRPVDREDTRIIDTIITVSVEPKDGGPPLIVPLKRQVPVEDVNDNAPKFESGPYSFSVEESASLGATLYSDVMVRDTDSGRNSEINITCAVRQSGDACSVFDVRTVRTGESEAMAVISLTRALDYELTQQYDIVLVARDNGDDGGLSSSTTVSVTLTDVQDEPPVFLNSPFSATVREGVAESRELLQGTRVLRVKAQDADKGRPRPLTLSLEGDTKGYFVLQDVHEDDHGVTNAIITTSHKLLDREDADIMNNGGLYSFTIKAQEIGGSEADSTTAPVTIVVTDADDQLPVFSSSEIHVTVREDLANGTPLSGLDLTVADEDLGDNAKFDLSLEDVSPSGSTGVFTVFPKTVVGRSPVIIKVADSSKIDFENPDASQFVVKVVASQDGVAVSSSIVIMNVTDANDNPPAFDSPSYRSVGFCRSCLPTGQWAYAGLALLQVSGLMQVLPSYRSVGLCRSCPPTGFLVEKLEAMDPDGDPTKGDIASYRLGRGAGDTFVVDGATGEVRLASIVHLDRDDTQQYQIEVLAVDRDEDVPQTATVTLTVDVLDVNNKPPTFLNPSYTAHVSERLPLGSPVLTVGARDPDEDAELLYALSTPIVARDRTGVTLAQDSVYDFRGAFSVNGTTGAVTVAGPLDHSEAAVLILTVTVTDTNASSAMPNQTDSAEVTIYIQAFSDKNPIFSAPWTPSHPRLTIELKEEEPLHKPVFAVTAKDPVSGQPVRRYEKVQDSDPEDVFAVAPITGQVSLNRRVDYEASQTKSASLRVIAMAGDRSSETLVTVNVLDINDNSPQFTEEEYLARVSEDSRWPSAVLTVHADDPDTGAFGTVRYSLGGEAAMLFVINDTTGEITVARGAELDREHQAVLTLEVIATDTPGGGLTSRWAAVKVSIELTDVNDEAPAWSEKAYTAVVAENAVVGAPVTHVVARDPDAGLNGLVRYFLPENQVPLDGLFSLDPESGILTVSAALRGKGRGEPYELTVQAMDQGSPQQFSEATIKLFIGDVSSNDGVPKFIHPAPNEVASVLENSKAGTAVFQVSAVDPDDPNSPNGKLVYSFLDNTANNGLFLIDSQTGLITTQVSLDRERQASYSVVVVAQDLGRPPQQASRVLAINVTDADDNDPIFLKQAQGTVEMHLEEEAAPGTVVGEVAATDRDEGDNALIDYAITYGNDEGLVELERTENNTARIVVRRRIDREHISSITLTLACARLDTRLPSRLPYSPGDPSLLQVRIIIKDLDDNKPKFESELVQAGVRVDAPLQTEVVTVTAVDPDPTSPPVKYHIHNITFEHSSASYPLLPSGVMEVTGVFLLEEVTGRLLTHAPLTRYTHGTFTIGVSAVSEPQQPPVHATIRVVVVRDSDLMRFVFDVPPGDVRPKLQVFRDQVEESLPVVANLAIYDTVYYTDHNGATDFSKTGSCFQLEDRNREETEVLLDAEENPRLKEVYDKYGVTTVERCVARVVNRAGATDWVEVWVLLLAALIGVGAAIAACTVCCLYSRYKKKLRKQQPHFRLLDSPAPAHMGPAGPGSLIMLPPGPAIHPGHMRPHVSVPPSEAGRPYEWQERGIPIDAISFSSVAR
ncbi:Cadherin [Trinorchestia longiramus]|nr:Cadherin [Trinorchestia longiramus]